LLFSLVVLFGLQARKITEAKPNAIVVNIVGFFIII